jgi:hypothetical protein
MILTNFVAISFSPQCQYVKDFSVFCQFLNSFMWLKNKFTCGHILVVVRNSSLKLTETKLLLNIGLQSLVSHEGIAFLDHTDDSETL